MKAKVTTVSNTRRWIPKILDLSTKWRQVVTFTNLLLLSLWSCWMQSWVDREPIWTRWYREIHVSSGFWTLAIQIILSHFIDSATIVISNCLLSIYMCNILQYSSTFYLLFLLALLRQEMEQCLIQRNLQIMVMQLEMVFLLMNH
jgi:hypothetical protein